MGWGTFAFYSVLGGVELLPPLPVGDLPKESVGFHKLLREPRTVGPKGCYDGARKRAAPRCPRRRPRLARPRHRQPERSVDLVRRGPTARTYAGMVPRAKQEAPTTKSQAMAEFRRTGSARTLTRGPERAGGSPERPPRVLRLVGSVFSAAPHDRLLA
jgi:hypothetical protein